MVYIMTNKNLIAYLTAFVLFMQSSALTLGVVATGISMLTTNNASAQEATSDTPLLDNLKTQYNVDDPYRNHRNTDKVYKTLGVPLNDPTKNLSGLLAPSTDQTRTLVLPPTPISSQSPNQLLSQFEGDALALGLSNSTPQGDANGNLDVRYAKEGTRKFTRDADGKLVMGVVDGVPEYVDGISKEDVLSSEINRSDYNFNADKAYGDNDLLINEGKESHRIMSTGTNASSRAYQMVTQIANRGINTTVPENSAFLQASRDTYQDVQSPTGGFFSACSTTTETRAEDINYPVYEEFNCQKNTAQNLDYCEVERELRIPIVVQGSNFESCGVNCFELTLGREGNNYYQPACGDKCGSEIFSESQAVKLNLGQGIRLSSVSASAVFDDHFEFLINGALAFSLIDGTFSYTTKLPLPPPNAGRDFAERGDSTMGMRNVSFGFLRNINQGADNTYNFTVNTLVGGLGDMHMKVRFLFEDETGEGFGEIITQSPEGCLDKVTAPTTSVQQCRFDGYTPLETGTRGFPQEFLDYLPPFYPGDTANKTWKMTLDNYRCDPFGGEEYCTTNAKTGVVDCFNWDELLDAPNACQVYEEDTSCKEIARECTDGWSIDLEGNSLCYNETVTFQCESGPTITRQVERQTSSCAGALPCVGGDCEFGETESNDRFVEAAVQANILQQVDGDRSCSDKGDPSTCKIFTGEAEYCSWEVTGLGMDCCESPGGLDILTYVMTANLMLETNRMAADGLFGATAESGADSLISYTDGAYTAIQDGVSSGWNTISTPITSAYNSLMGNATNAVVDASGEVIAESAVGASEGVITSTLATLQQETYKLVYDMMPEQLSELLFTQVTDEAAKETGELILNEAVSSALQSVMAAYAIYSYVKLALTLLTMCDENESDMGIKIGQRQCFKVGGDYCSKDVLGLCYQKRQNYCCYNSILARIVMKQAGPLLGKDLTTCEGLTQEELGRLDFKKIDLSEWVGLMVESGSIQDEGSEQALTGGGTLVESRCETFDVENPETGVITTEQRCFKELEGGRQINTYGRENVSDRTMERMDGADVYSQEIQDNARGVANNLDCSATPRPPVCAYGFDVRSAGGS